MKVWYQSFTRNDIFSRYYATLGEILRSQLHSGMELDLHAVPRPAGHADHQFRYFEMVDTRDIVSNALRAQAEGYSAYLIGNILDPGLNCAREVTDIPVLGLCDASITMACQMGRTYGFVTINEQQAYRIERNVQEYGTGSRFNGWESLDIDNYPGIDDNYDGPAMTEFVKRFQEKSMALSERGAEVVIPGGGVVMALLDKAGLRKVGSVPVVSGLRSLVTMGIACASMYEQQGAFTSKRLAYAGPPPDAMKEIRDSMGGHLLEGPIGMPT